MPKRPRSHRIEDESRIKFESLIPERWLYRPKSHDYGIDGEVEIFNEDDTATGLIFNVQLKATDSQDLSIVKSVSLDIETIKYFYSLDLPVLIVRFTSHLDEFYVKWASSIDLYYAEPKSKTLAIRFGDTDKWNDNTASNIEKRLKLLRSIKDNTLPFPYKTSFEIKDPTAISAPRILFISRLKSEIVSFEDIVTYDENAAESTVIVELYKSKLQVEIIGMRGVVFHLDDSIYSDVDGVKTIIRLVVTSIGICTILNGLPERGYRILTDNDMLISTLDIPMFFPVCLQKLMCSSIYKDLLEDIGKAYQESISKDMILTIPLVLRACVAGDHIREAALAVFMDKGLKKVCARCDKHEIGAYTYNLGNLYRSLSRHREAYHFYWKAKIHSPKYLERSYYYKELAGVLFRLDRFELSAKLYAIALECGDDPLPIALQADALMFSGQYSVALAKFIDFLQQKPHLELIDSEWELKRISLEYIVKGWSISNHTRNPRLANSIALHENPTLDSLEKAIEADALCGSAWFNIGYLLMADSTWDEAAICFMICGLIQPWDIEAWVKAVISSVAAKLPSEHMLLVLAHAYRLNRDSFRSELYESLYASLEQEKADEISSMFETIIDGVKKEFKPQDQLILRNDGIIFYP